MSLDYIQATCKFYTLDTYGRDYGNSFISITMKTDVISGTSITDMSNYLNTNPPVYQLQKTPHFFSPQENVSFNIEDKWIPSEIPVLQRVWNVYNCDSQGQNALPIGDVSTGKNKMIIGNQ